MEKEWHKITSFNGSQANAFEELVCQLAMAESDPRLEDFERVGTPDGGVECYWKLKDGSEWGWQAKFYENLSSSEWNAIKKSLFDAANTHPNLCRYYICIPHNLSDARRDKRTQKRIWDEYRIQWMNDLLSQGKHIELILWNSSTIFSKLLTPVNIGIKFLLFEEIQIKEEKLFLDLEAAIANLGPKYSPDLNFKLDYLPSVFDALSRNDQFSASFKNKLDRLLEELSDVIRDSSYHKETNSIQKQLKIQFDLLIELFNHTDFSPVRPIPVENYLQIIQDCLNLTDELKNTYKEIDSKAKENEKNTAQVEKPTFNYSSRRKTASENDRIFKFEGKANEIQAFLNGPLLRVANEGILFLKGMPGTGKSHSVADIALNRKQRKIPSILLLGEHFSNQHPRISLQQSLIPGRHLEDYLSALETLAKSKQERILFIIDAINEGAGKYIWKNSIAGLVTELRKFKWIGFAFSYRTTFEEVLIPENFNPPLITHFGFEGREYEATKRFFEYYKIQQPAVPILNPEFSNPLFLKTFCLTLNKAGKSTIPEGYEGISKILEAYLIAVNKNIGERLSFNHRRINLVEKALENLVDYQIKTGEQIIPWDEAFQLLDPLLKIYSTQTGLVEELIREGLLIEDYYYDSDSQKHEQHGVLFNYERFNEHLKALYLLKKYKNSSDLQKAFAAQGMLQSLFIDKHGFTGLNTGLLNALAIIVPEIFQIEIYEVFKVKDRYADHHIYTAFLQSLIWRKHNSVTQKSWQYIRNRINGNETHLLDFFNTIFLLSASPVSYFNANFVHKLLKDRDVAERDHIWSIPIDKLWNWYEKNSLKRIIDWSWSNEEKTYVGDSSIVLLGKIVAWMFTNSNRKIRDTATKAFVALFTDRVHLLKDFIKEFSNVNDPYVLERVAAGAYGSIVHSCDIEASVDVAQYIYDLYFRHKKPPLNILTRDYLKGIIELATEKGGNVSYLKENLYAPFDYSLPNDFPDDNWVNSLKIDKTGQYTHGERAQAQILHSVLTWDFARYILGTNFRSTIPFTNYPIESRVAYETLKKQLRGHKKKFFEMYVEATNAIDGTSEIGKKLRRIYDQKELDSNLNIFKIAIETGLRYLKENLNTQQLSLLEQSNTYIKEGLESRSHDKKRFPVKLVQHYILKKVFELGWNMDLFGEYDSNIDEGYRRENKPERVGKKYQWIGYYEILALLSDNYDFFDRHNTSDLPYLGTWQHNLRNIDPTCISQLSPSNEEDHAEYPWWLKETYSNWREDRGTWLNRFDDMPNFKNIIVIKDDRGTEWYLLYDRIIWQSPKSVGEDRFKSDHRELWIDFNGYIVSKETKRLLLKKGSEKLYWIGKEIPENPEAYNIFLGEWYHSEAYKNTIHSNHIQSPYTSFPLKDKNVNIIHTVEEYGFSSGYDLSGERVRVYKPSKFLLTLLNGTTGKNDACVYDKEGRIIAMDAGVYKNERNNSLLVKKTVLDSCLEKNNLELVWCFCGEKEDIGANTSFVYRMLFSGFCGFLNGKYRISFFHEREE